MLILSFKGTLNSVILSFGVLVAIIYSCHEAQKQVKNLIERNYKEKHVLQIIAILLKIGKLDSERVNIGADSIFENLNKLHHQMSIQPVRFTTAGFYTINLPFLASVR